MTLAVRRVVTGHDANGKAVVKIDDVSLNRPPRDPNNTVNETTVVWRRRRNASESAPP